MDKPIPRPDSWGEAWSSFCGAFWCCWTNRASNLASFMEQPGFCVFYIQPELGLAHARLGYLEYTSKEERDRRHATPNATALVWRSGRSAHNSPAQYQVGWCTSCFQHFHWYVFPSRAPRRHLRSLRPVFIDNWAKITAFHMAQGTSCVRPYTTCPTVRL